MQNIWYILPINVVLFVVVFGILMGLKLKYKKTPSLTFQLVWFVPWALFNLRYLALPVEEAIAVFIGIYDPFHNFFPGFASFLPCPETYPNCSVLGSEYPLHANWMIGFLDNFRFDQLATQMLVVHVVLNSLAMTLFPIQFWLIKKRSIYWHKIIGSLIFLSAVIGTNVAMVISLKKHHLIPEYGGYISTIGFATMWASIMVTSFLGVLFLKKGDLYNHKKWMIRLYGALFGSYFIFRILPLTFQWLLPSPVDVFVYETASWILGILLFEWGAKRLNVLKPVHKL